MACHYGLLQLVLLHFFKQAETQKDWMLLSYQLGFCTLNADFFIFYFQLSFLVHPSSPLNSQNIYWNCIWDVLKMPCFPFNVSIAMLHIHNTAI